MKFDYKSITNEICSKDFWSRLLVMAFSVFILAINYNLFLLPNDFVIGGVSGIAIIFNEYTGIDPAAFVLILNILFLIASFIFLGNRSTGMTIIGSLLYPAFISITEPLCQAILPYLTLDNYILVALIAGLLLGTGDGFIYKTGYSTGGCDIIFKILNKYFKMSTGTASLIVSLIIILSGGLIFGLNKAIYSIIVVLINGILVDKIMLGISDSKMFYIHTDKPERIKDFIKELQSAYTIIKAEDFNGKRTELIMCVISTKDYYLFKNIIAKIDPDAFFIISDCYEVYGGKRKAKFPFI